MFTGLIEEVGIVASVEILPQGCRFSISCKKILAAIKIGDSVSVSGACQTVEQFTGSAFTIFSIPETLAVTNFAAYTVGTHVNLERAMRLGDRIGGHLVQGHVEGTALLVGIDQATAHNYILSYNSPYILPKGSVTLDGISLTVMETFADNKFRVQIIPETLAKTNILTWQIGSRINIEVDYIIKSLDLVRQNQPR